VQNGIYVKFSLSSSPFWSLLLFWEWLQNRNDTPEKPLFCYTSKPLLEKVSKSELPHFVRQSRLPHFFLPLHFSQEMQFPGGRFQSGQRSSRRVKIGQIWHLFFCHTFKNHQDLINNSSPSRIRSCAFHISSLSQSSSISSCFFRSTNIASISSADRFFPERKARKFAISCLLSGEESCLFVIP